MEKKIYTKKIIVIPIIVVVLVMAVYFLFFASKPKANSATTYQVAEVTTGDLTQAITGTGTIWPGKSVDVVAPFDLKVLSVEVQSGQSIKAGDTIAKLDTGVLDSVISHLKDEISSIDDAILRLKESESSTEIIKSPISGRVKEIFTESGDNVKSVISEHGALLTISTDGKMKVTIETSEVEEGDSVSVNVDSNTYSGTVVDVSNGKATITLTDDGTAVDATATVYTSDGNKLGSGFLSINQPVKVTADVGTVSKVYVNDNSKVYKNTPLVYLKDLPASEEYETQIESRLKKQNLLLAAQKMRESGRLVSEYDGIINDITINDGTQVAENSQILSIYTDGADTLTVSIDELDIGNVEEGQDAKITVDAIEDKMYDATVETISQVGEVNSGVTTYDVKLKVEGDEKLKIGMNATAEIIVEERTDILLLPLEAVQSTQGEQYVWLYTGNLPKDSGEDPGERTVVSTGLSDDSYVEITDGLDADDKVVIVRTKATNTNRQRGEMMAPGGMDMGTPGKMENNFPQGGPPPSDGGAGPQGRRRD